MEEVNECWDSKLEPMMILGPDNDHGESDRGSIGEAEGVNSSLALFDDALRSGGDKNNDDNGDNDNATLPTDSQLTAITKNQTNQTATTSKAKDTESLAPRPVFHLNDNLKRNLSMLAYPSKSILKKKGVVPSKHVSNYRITIGEALEKANDSRRSIGTMDVADKGDSNDSVASSSSIQIVSSRSSSPRIDSPCEDMIVVGQQQPQSDVTLESSSRGDVMTLDPTETSIELVAEEVVVNDASVGSEIATTCIEGKAEVVGGGGGGAPKSKGGGVGGSGGGPSTSSSSSKVQMTRRMWELLKFTFDHEHFPSSVHMARLAKMMGRPWSQIRNWFTDRRVENKKAGIFPRDRALTECHYCHIRLDSESAQKTHLFSAQHVKTVLGDDYCPGVPANENIRWKKLPKTINAVSKMSGARILAVGFNTMEKEGKKTQERWRRDAANEKTGGSKELKKLWTDAMLQPDGRREAGGDTNPVNPGPSRDDETYSEAYIDGRKDSTLRLKVHSKRDSVRDPNDHENAFAGGYAYKTKPGDVPSRRNSFPLTSTAIDPVAGSSRDPDPVFPSPSTSMSQSQEPHRTYQDEDPFLRSGLQGQEGKRRHKIKRSASVESRSSDTPPVPQQSDGDSLKIPSELESELLALSEANRKNILGPALSRCHESEPRTEGEAWRNNNITLYKDEGVTQKSGLALVNPNRQSFTMDRTSPMLPSYVKNLNRQPKTRYVNDGPPASRTLRATADRKRLKAQTQPLVSVLRSSRRNAALLEGNIIVGYQCPKCNKVFQTEWLMIKHSITHFRYHCDICYQVYPTENMMKIHLLDHLSSAYEDEKYYCQFSCKVCHSLKCGCYEPTYCKPRDMKVYPRPQKAKRTKKGFITKLNSGPNDHLKISLATYRKLLHSQSLGNNAKANVPDAPKQEVLKQQPSQPQRLTQSQPLKHTPKDPQQTFKHPDPPTFKHPDPPPFKQPQPVSQPPKPQPVKDSQPTTQPPKQPQPPRPSSPTEPLEPEPTTETLKQDQPSVEPLEEPQSASEPLQPPPTEPQKSQSPATESLKPPQSPPTEPQNQSQPTSPYREHKPLTSPLREPKPPSQTLKSLPTSPLKEAQQTSPVKQTHLTTEPPNQPQPPAQPSVQHSPQPKAVDSQKLTAEPKNQVTPYASKEDTAPVDDTPDNTTTTTTTTTTPVDATPEKTTPQPEMASESDGKATPRKVMDGGGLNDSPGHTPVSPTEAKLVNVKKRKSPEGNDMNEVVEEAQGHKKGPGGRRRATRSKKESNNFVYNEAGFYYLCEMCDASFTSKSELSEHMFLHRLKFRSRRGEKRGLSASEEHDAKKPKLEPEEGDGSKVPTCTECQCTFPTMVDYREHAEVAHCKPSATTQKNEVYRCNYCDKNYRRMRELKRHLKRDCVAVPRAVRDQVSVNDVDPIHYTTVTLDFDDDKDAAAKVTKPRGPIMCKFCSAITKREAEMKRHIWKFCPKVPHSVVKRFMEGTSLEDLGFRFLNKDEFPDAIPKEEPQDMETSTPGTPIEPQEPEGLQSPENHPSAEKPISVDSKTKHSISTPNAEQTQGSTNTNPTRRMLSIRRDLFEDYQPTPTEPNSDTESLPDLNKEVQSAKPTQVKGSDGRGNEVAGTKGTSEVSEEKDGTKTLPKELDTQRSSQTQTKVAREQEHTTESTKGQDATRTTLKEQDLATKSTSKEHQTKSQKEQSSVKSQSRTQGYKTKYLTKEQIENLLKEKPMKSILKQRAMKSKQERVQTSSKEQPMGQMPEQDPSKPVPKEANTQPTTSQAERSRLPETNRDSTFKGGKVMQTIPSSNSLASPVMQIPSVNPVASVTSKAKRPLVCGYCGIWYFREMAIMKHMKERCIKIPAMEKELLKANNMICNASQKPGQGDSESGAVYKMVKVPEHLQNTPVPMPKDVSNEDIKELNSKIKVYGETQSETKKKEESTTASTTSNTSMSTASTLPTQTSSETVPPPTPSPHTISPADSPQTITPPALSPTSSVSSPAPSPAKKGSRCRRCHEHFDSQDAVLAHSSVHHGPKKGLYRCKLCNARIGKYKNLREHVWEHTNETPYRCHLCGVQYRNSDLIVGHLLNVHQFTSIHEKNLYKWLPGRHGRYREIKTKPSDNCEEKLEYLDTSLESVAEVMMITDKDLCADDDTKDISKDEKVTSEVGSGDGKESSESPDIKPSDVKPSDRTDTKDSAGDEVLEEDGADSASGRSASAGSARGRKGLRGRPRKSLSGRIEKKADERNLGAGPTGRKVEELNVGAGPMGRKPDERNVYPGKKTYEHNAGKKSKTGTRGEDTEEMSVDSDSLNDDLLPLVDNLDSVIETIQLTDKDLS